MNEETQTWLDMLFVPDDIFEIRTKGDGDRGVAWRGWGVMGKSNDKFLTNVLPVSRSMKKNVWVGVCPRTENGSSVPSVARVVWVDCDGVGVEEVNSSIVNLKLPPPTMVVDSGHGVHVYWALNEAVPAQEVRPVTKWLSRNVAGADGGTYDPTRILRVPGTYNFKNTPVICSIVHHDPNAKYDLSDFPSAKEEVQEYVSTVPTIDALSPAQIEAISAAWQEGQRHPVALAAAGYLRKRGYEAHNALETLLGIHYANGGEHDDENYNDIQRIVRTTYSKPLALIQGYQGLVALGVELPDEEFTFTFPKMQPPKVSMGLIDFSQTLAPQEFWVDGLVGPGLLTMIAAQPKAGKSMVAMQLGHAISNGYKAFDFDTDGRKHSVLYFQGELSRGMVYQRAKAMFPKGTYEDVRYFGMTDKPDKTLDLVSNPEPLYDLAEHYEVIIIDPLSIFNANDENSVTTVRETLSVFDTLKAQGKAVILVHHTKKLDSNRDGTTVTPSVSDVRGSGAWFAAVDALGILYGLGESGNAQMKFVFRAAPERKPMNLYRLPHGGFTSDRDAYMKILSQRGLNIPLGTVELN